jgi:hypothetical protein
MPLQKRLLPVRRRPSYQHDNMMHFKNKHIHSHTHHMYISFSFCCC